MNAEMIAELARPDMTVLVHEEGCALAYERACDCTPHVEPLADET